MVAGDGWRSFKASINLDFSVSIPIVVIIVIVTLNYNTPTSYDRLILDLLPTEYIGDNRQPNESLYKRVLNICAYVSSMTDSYAISLFKKLKGIELPE